MASPFVESDSGNMGVTVSRMNLEACLKEHSDGDTSTLRYVYIQNIKASSLYAPNDTIGRPRANHRVISACPESNMTLILARS